MDRVAGHAGRGDTISLEQRIIALEKCLGIDDIFSGSKPTEVN